MLMFPRRVRVLRTLHTSSHGLQTGVLSRGLNFQSQQMQQGLKDERKILMMYEEIVGCKVSKEGFIISSTHPFLGASPDGVVIEECLVEVKRIFPGTDTKRSSV